MADDYDFQIEAREWNADLQEYETVTLLKYRAAVSDKFPYVRGTAPFRKEQFDSSGRAGDQSLTGWWTRGQLSFHKGAGLNFYEVQAGDEALDRFRLSSQVNPWVPGEVSLAGETRQRADIQAPASIYSAALWFDALFVVESYTTAGSFYKNGTVVNTTSAFDPQCCAVTTYLGGRVIVGVARDIEVMLPTSSGPTTNLWTNDDMAVGVNYTHLFWAKDRIWGPSSDGVWYVLDHAGGTVASGGPERFWEDELSLDWSLADTPGGVYISRDQYVWLVTVDPDTGALSTPRVVADLGEGALIKSIKHNRGYLGICTERGFLVGFIQDSGDLTLGPMFLKYGESACKSIVANGSSFFFLACHEDDLEPAEIDQLQSVYEVNLVDEVATLQPAWTIRERGAITGLPAFLFPTSGSSQYFSVAGGALTAFEGLIPGPFADESSAGQGDITTAQHRLGTLELKKFHTLRVTAEVDESDPGNYVACTSVRPDGSTDFLGQVGDGQTDLDLSHLRPGESLGFQFELNWSSGNVTKFLGYQLKALPVPERQRLLRWPLAIADVVRLKGGTEVGRKGRAYEALTELEQLETDSAVIRFTDHRTGETGDAYIDQVEFQGDTPSNRNGGNFGGIAYVTLRVIG